MRLVRFAACLGLLSTLSGTADAQLVVVEEPGDEPAVEHAELAYASGDGPPVTWISLRLRRTPVALVAAIADDASADAAPDAWFSALEITASPRVLAPPGATNCGEAPGSLEVAWARGAGEPAFESEVESAEDVEATLAEQGLSLTAPLPAAARYVVWTWTDLAQAVSTRTLRVTGGPAPLALLPGSTFPVLLSAITRGPMVLPREEGPGVLDFSYFAGEKPHTDYRTQLEDWLAGSARPLVETRSHHVLLDWTIQGDFTIAPLVTSYARRAANELPDVDASACANELRVLRFKPETTLEPAACGAARDAWLALKSASPDLLTLQRYALSSVNGFDPRTLSEGGEPRGPALRAQQLDDSACPEPMEPPQVVNPPIVVRPEPEPPRGETPGYVEEETVVVEHYESTEIDCGGSPRTYRDEEYESEPACSSDTSSSYESDSNSNSDADCSSDTSSSSADSNSDADCSSDTSSTSSSDDDTDCSSDTSSSSSSSDDDTDCSSDTSSSSDDGYDGDTTCSVGAGPRRRIQRPQRLKVTLWSVAFAALALTIRRRKRGARAGG